MTHKQLSSDTLFERLQALHISGLDYKIIRTRNTKGDTVSGVYIGINNWGTLKPTELSFYMMQMVIELESPNPFQTTTRSDLFNKHVGSTQWWSELTQNKRRPRIQYFLNLWKKQHQKYKEKIENYLIYN